MTTQLDAEHWMRIIKETMTELATLALGFGTCEMTEDSSAIPADMIGAYLPLGTSQEPMQVGLLSTPDGCQRLAKALLGMESGDDDLEPADVSDAISELANLLAGGIKRRIPEGGAEIKLGLPLFVRGPVEPNEHLAILTAELSLGPVSAVVLFATARSSIVTHLADPAARVG